jgi:membrane protease YdiL (CAAX protease family)
MRWSFLSPVGRRERQAVSWILWAVLTVAFCFSAWLGVATLLQALDPSLPELAERTEPLPRTPGRLIDETRYTLLISSLLLATALSALFAARLAFQRPAWTFLTPAHPFRPRLLTLGFAVFGTLAVLGVLGASALNGKTLSPPVLDDFYPLNTRLLYAGCTAVFLLMAALAEEILFRGVLLQATGAFTRSLPVLLLVNGALFSAIHLDPAPDAFLVRAASGAVWAWTVLRLAGLEFAIGAHLANNLVLSLLVEPISEGAQTGRNLPLSVTLLDLAISGALVLILLTAVRSPRLCAWAGIDLPAEPAEEPTGRSR